MHISWFKPWTCGGLKSQHFSYQQQASLAPWSSSTMPFPSKRTKTLWRRGWYEGKVGQNAVGAQSQWQWQPGREQLKMKKQKHIIGWSHSKGTQKPARRAVLEMRTGPIRVKRSGVEEKVGLHASVQISGVTGKIRDGEETDFPCKIPTWWHR